MNAFLTLCGTLEWISAYTVYEKYKRSMRLEHEHLVELRNHITNFSIQRIVNNQKVNEGILIQEAGKYVKNLNINNNDNTL